MSSPSRRCARLGGWLALAALSASCMSPPTAPPAPSPAPVAAAPAPAAPVAADDPYLWLEDIHGERAMAWVRDFNARTQATLMAQPQYEPIRADLLAILQSQARLPQITRIGGHVYNFWTDARNPRGLWRRTTLADYRLAAPRWETVLDVDALNAAEKESWVWAGASCLPAATEAGVDRCLVALSRGGTDARVHREFDLVTKSFVAGGFVVPQAKGWLDWIDRDTLYVASDFGAGSMTASGYPRTVRRWTRGTPLDQAPVVFEAQATDVLVEVEVDPTPGRVQHLFTRWLDFHRKEYTLLVAGGAPRKLALPADVALTLDGDRMLLLLRTAQRLGGRDFPAGALVATSRDAFLAGNPRFEVLFTPSATRSLSRGGVQLTRSRVLLDVMDNVGSRLEEWSLQDGRWQGREVPLPGPAGQAWTQPLRSAALADDPLADAYLLGYEDFLLPQTLYLARAGTSERAELRRNPEFFDAFGMRVEQRLATSRDGTRVPYYVVWPRGATATGNHPTLLSAYGGFQIPSRPQYPLLLGKAWLARGGVWVVANIRGGGEFGPAWHRAGIREKKQNSYDDFIAVAQDLIASRVTSARQLGMMGGSNGGLMVGAVLTQRPDLFNAAVAQVPLFDMRRFHRLLAGASWVAEYGNPDEPADWAFMSRYSPYQNLRAGTRYPQTLITTSTRDDRVHPGHARKMAARMEAQGHEVLYYENIEGGHAGAADSPQRAHMRALELSYLWMRLGPARVAAAPPPGPAAPAASAPASRP